MLVEADAMRWKLAVVQVKAVPVRNRVVLEDSRRGSMGGGRLFSLAERAGRMSRAIGKTG